MRGFTDKRRAGALAVFICAGMAASGALAQGVPSGCVTADPGGAVAGAVIGGVAGALCVFSPKGPPNSKGRKVLIGGHNFAQRRGQMCVEAEPLRV